MKLISFLPLLFICTLLTAQKRTAVTIHFDFNRSVIRTADAKILDSLVAALPKNTDAISIQITGHCDSKGRDTYNDTLSLKRARSAEKYLLAKGVKASWITSIDGYGETQPLADIRFPTAFSDYQERRVELTITENSIPVQNTITKIISDTATRAGTNIILKNLNFEGGTHHLLNSSLPILHDLLNALQKNENLVIRIEGHICCEVDARDGYDPETRTYNLSEERAKTVYTFLVNNHINPQRLSIKGYGHQRPIFPYPEKTGDEEIANRRVEIKIISK